jgi:hypothetical protein
VDPDLQQTQQAYLYVGDDPVNASDPTGLRGGGAAGAAAAADRACGYDGSRSNSEACRAFEKHEEQEVTALKEGNGLLLFLIQGAGMVALGVITDGLGDAVVFGLEGGADAADVEVATESDAGGFTRFIERLRSLDYDDSGSAGYGKSKVPSWVFNEGWRAEAGETPVEAATRIMNERYGVGAWDKGPASEYNQIVKWISRTR